jgi:hypothetical protein
MGEMVLDVSLGINIKKINRLIDTNTFRHVACYKGHRKHGQVNLSFALAASSNHNFG